jgi:CubicO group peptidase (beta-lactamase class C family)
MNRQRNTERNGNRGRLRVSIAGLLIVVGFVTAPGLGAGGRQESGGAEAGSLSDEIARAIEKKVRAHGIVGLSAAVVANGQLVLCQGFGQADRRRGIAMTPRTLLPIGSNTKLFTATAIMQLAEAGRIDLDAPVTTYLPSFTIRRREGQEGVITVRRLLTHHSGLPSNLYRGFEPDAPDPEAFRRLPDELAQETLAAQPGSAFAYSNLGYSVLGCIVEQVSGEPYAAYVREHIFVPLGMDDTRFLPYDGADPWVSRGYRGREVVSVYPIRDVPAGSILSSAEDMTAFMRMILNHGTLEDRQILGHSAFEQMITRQNADVALDRDHSMGLGYWLIDPIGLAGERLASHGGDLPPFHSVLVTLPDAGIAVFLGANSSGARGTVITMASEIVRMVFGVVTGNPVQPPKPAPPSPLDSAGAASLVGWYASPLGLLEARARGGRLSLRLGAIPLRLIPRADGSCTAELPLLRLLGIRPAVLRGLTFEPFQVAGRQYIAIAAAGVAAGVAERLQPAALPGAWRERAGRYEIVEGNSAGLRRNLQDVELRYHRRSGLLLFRYRLLGQRMSLPVELLGPEEAVLAGKGSGLGEMLRFRTAHTGEVLYWSGLILERRN